MSKWTLCSPIFRILKQHTASQWFFAQLLANTLYSNCRLRAIFCKVQAGSDTDVGKNHPKYYHSETPHTIYFFLTLLLFLLQDTKLLVLLTVFFIKLCGYSYWWVKLCVFDAAESVWNTCFFSKSTAKSLGSHTFFFVFFLFHFWGPITPHAKNRLFGRILLKNMYIITSERPNY